MWDKKRNALLWPGGRPVVAHPPCRAWGRLAHFAKPEEGEKDLAMWAVEQVRRWGGVLEHPQSSRLWKAKELPRPGGVRDEWGGFSVSVDQHWWGHRANKETWLYICGLSEKLPAFPIRLDEGTHRIMWDTRRGTRSRNWWKKRLPTSEREKTPEAFAKWLVQVASICRPNAQAHRPPSTDL